MRIFLELHANWYFSFLNQRLNIPEVALQKEMVPLKETRCCNSADYNTSLVQSKGFQLHFNFWLKQQMLLLPMPQLPFPCITLCYLCHLINLGLSTYGIKSILHQSQFISLYSSAKAQGWIVTMERVRGEQCSTLGCIMELYNGQSVF